MKPIRTLWALLLNGGLILLPWVGGVLIVLHYGQPLLDQFKQFLGDPVSEVVTTSQRLRRQPGSDLSFQQLYKNFQQIGSRKNLGDTEQAQLRRALGIVHQNVARRLETSNPAAVYRTISDSYSRLLKSRLVRRVFSRPEAVHDRLMGDLRRLASLSRLPYHQAEGLSAFLMSSDSAARLVEHYGTMYADPHGCRSLFGLECDQLFGASTQITASSLGRYFTRWPRFAQSQPARTEVLLRFFPSLKHAYRTLIRDLSGYLRAPPWERFPDFREAHGSLQTMFQSNLQQWVVRALKNVSFPPEAFARDTPGSPSDTLRALLDLEKELQRDDLARELILNEDVREQRQKLYDRLAETYQWVSSTDQFDPTFQSDTEAVNLLVQTLQRNPEAAERLSKLRQQMGEIRSANRSLSDQLKNRQYRQLLESLQQLKDKLQPDDPIGWTIMMRHFLSNSRETITQPSWQPSGQQGQQTYARLIEQYGSLGQQLNVPHMNPEWARSTIVSLRSRRYNQLQHQIRSSLEPGDYRRTPDLKSQLRELLQLVNLPEPLSNRAPLVVFHALLIDRIHGQKPYLYQDFADRLSRPENRDSIWNELNTILRTIEQTSPSDALQERDLGKLTDGVESWLNRLPREAPMVSLVQSHMVQRLREFFEALVQNYQNWIRRKSKEYPPLDWLLGTYSNLQSGIERARTIQGFSYEPNLPAWRQVLLLREHIQNLTQTVSNLEKGSLIGGNPAFAEFQEQLQQYDLGSLPEEYEPSVEVDLIRRLHRRLIDRARRIHQSARSDWLAGWGGRVTGTQVMMEWENFLSGLRNASTNDFFRQRLRTLIEDCQQLRQEWGS